MKVSEIASVLEQVAPLSLQEEYDNSGLLLGNPDTICTGILCTLDVTDAVIHEAINRKCNFILAHHPIIFKGMKKINGGNLVERVVIAAIKNDIAVYAAHTNLDNISAGVNGKIADLLGLRNRQVLESKEGVLKKLFTFVPPDHLEKVRSALFAAGAGSISRYTECSFTQIGTGTFKPSEGSDPFVGTVGVRQNEQEVKLEVILPASAEKQVLGALFEAHPYEEVAYDMVSLSNLHQGTGSGIIGKIDPVPEATFLEKLQVFNPVLVRHSAFRNKMIQSVAVCGGAGSFLISNALRMGADAFVTSDLKYHDFFLPDGRLLLCDIGHFESEQYTVDLFIEILEQKFPNFAVLKSEVKTNPVLYFTGK
jgi:dinuclear metal center YbgI/SA1388 family protein